MTQPTADRPPRPVVLPVPSGTAENLARLAHFATFEDHPQIDQLDQIALFLIGDVGPAPAARLLWERLRGDLLRLWRLITDDYADDDYDDLPPFEEDREPFITYEAWLEDRRDATVTRLGFDVEQAIACARITGTRPAPAGAR